MEYLPKDVAEGLDAARALARKSHRRLRVCAGGQEFRVLRLWPGGFALNAEESARLPGRVDLYDGATHICQALVLASSEEGGERVFEFKTATHAADVPPPADFAREADAPAGLLPPA